MKLYDLFLEIAKESTYSYAKEIGFGKLKGNDISNKIDELYKKLIAQTAVIKRYDTLVMTKKAVANPKYDETIANVDLKQDSYFVYDYCSHADDWIITEFKNEYEVEKYLNEELGGLYTTEMIVFRNKKVLDFRYKNGAIKLIIA